MKVGGKVYFNFNILVKANSHIWQSLSLARPKVPRATQKDRGRKCLLVPTTQETKANPIISNQAKNGATSCARYNQ